MIRRKDWLSLSVIFLAFGAFAQPPQEVPPPLPETATEVQAVPAPQAPAAQIAPQPVAEPKELPKPAAPPEDKTVRGVSISPGIAVYPIGYDSINVMGDDEGGRFFFALKPQLGISSSFKTATEKVVDFSIDYSLTWREYFNKVTTSRDFESDASGSLTVPWNDRLSTTLATDLAYFYKAGADTSEDNALVIDTEPQLWVKANDQLKFKISYWVRFLDILDSPVDWWEVNRISDPPSDLDELRRGTTLSDVTADSNYGARTTTEAMWQNFHAAVTGLKYSPIKGTNLGMDYRFVFAGFSNADAAEWTGHYLIPSASQALPWEGGTIVLKDEMRFRKFKYATIFDGSAKQSFRNRLTFAVNQAINKYMTAEVFYRWEVSGQNADDYSKLDHNHWFFTGVSFGF